MSGGGARPVMCVNFVAKRPRGGGDEQGCQSGTVVEIQGGERNLD